MLIFFSFHLYTTGFPDGRGAEEKTLLSLLLSTFLSAFSPTLGGFRRKFSTLSAQFESRAEKPPPDPTSSVYVHSRSVSLFM